MARQRVIVGLGEAILVEHPDRSEAAGLGAAIALEAVGLGERGIVVSRIGQDPQGEELHTLLSDAGVEVDHVQTDPDLPTGRVIVRPIGDPVRRHLEAKAAFDNLQADFDLEDVAQQADAVIYGLLTRRGGQTRAEEDRFLASCGAALKLFDLTNRAETLDRGHASTGLELADAVITDTAAAEAVLPGARGADVADQAARLLREFSLMFVCTVEEVRDARRLHLHTADEAHTVSLPATDAARPSMTVALMHALLRGRTPVEAAELAGRVASHRAEHPEEPVPTGWLG